LRAKQIDVLSDELKQFIRHPARNRLRDDCAQLFRGVVNTAGSDHCRSGTYQSRAKSDRCSSIG
jgi:hypothetical protein